FLVFIVGIFVRLFVALALPDFAMTDTVYYLSLARVVTQTGVLSLENLWLAFFNTFLATASILSGLEISPATTNVFAFFVSIVQLLMAFVLLRKISPTRWVYGMAIFTVLPLLTKFAGINYIETIASIFVMFSLYLYIQFRETAKTKFLILALFSLVAMSLSKLNGAILLPAFLIGFVVASKRTKFNKKTIAVFAIATILLSSSWVFLDFTRTGQMFPSNSTDTGRLPSYPGIVANSVLNPGNFVNFWTRFNLAFWNIPPADAISKAIGMIPLPFLTSIPVELLLSIFFWLGFAMLLFLAGSIFYLAKERWHYARIVLLILLFGFLVVMLRIHRGLAYARLFLPVMPLLAISFTHGFNALSGKWENVKKVVAALVVILAVYSFLSVSFFALYYNNSFNKNLTLYEEIGTLPIGGKILLSGNQARILNWYSEIESLGPEGAFGIHHEGEVWKKFYEENGRIPTGDDIEKITKTIPKEKLYAKMKELSVTHFALTCNLDDPWNRETVGMMEQEGKLSKIFEHECTALFEVN
ncbi:MAG: hypothetical protein QGI60_04030, partial [archaeon]|nr:hypothetical protein [archaeon]